MASSSQFLAKYEELKAYYEADIATKAKAEQIKAEEELAREQRLNKGEGIHYFADYAHPKTLYAIDTYQNENLIEINDDRFEFGSHRIA